ncbi:MAG: hypothetical protein AAGF81_01560 [Pseudomonadota bacterium]
MDSIVVNRGQKKHAPRQTATVHYKPSAKRLAQQDLPRIPRTSKYRTKPWLLTAARRDRPDDLTQIPGLTVRAQSALNVLGIFHFDQIALWDDANVAWLQERWPTACDLAPRELIGPSKKLL